MSNMGYIKQTLRRARLAFAAIAVTVFATLPVLAADATTQSISQGFKAEDTLAVGTLVSYADDSSKLTVVAASSNSVSRLAGVVGQNALIELSDGTTQTQVVTNGSALALVSDINGEILAGDKITISPIQGVGMKALENGTVVGTARESFSDAQEVHEVEVTDRSGQKKTVKAGLVPVQVSVTYYEMQDTNKTILPAFIMRLAQSISGGKEVSVVRVVIALVVLLTGIFVIGMLVYASVRSSIVSIGRNPLAAKSINRSLLEVSAMAFGILLVMLIAVYLILVT